MYGSNYLQALFIRVIIIVVITSRLCRVKALMLEIIITLCAWRSPRQLMTWRHLNIHSSAIHYRSNLIRVCNVVTEEILQRHVKEIIRSHRFFSIMALHEPIMTCWEIWAMETNFNDIWIKTDLSFLEKLLFKCHLEKFALFLDLKLSIPLMLKTGIFRKNCVKALLLMPWCLALRHGVLTIRDKWVRVFHGVGFQPPTRAISVLINDRSCKHIFYVSSN